MTLMVTRYWPWNPVRLMLLTDPTVWFLRLMVRRAQHVSKLENEVERLKKFERREESIVGAVRKWFN